MKNQKLNFIILLFSFFILLATFARADLTCNQRLPANASFNDDSCGLTYGGSVIPDAYGHITMIYNKPSAILFNATNALVNFKIGGVVETADLGASGCFLTNSSTIIVRASSALYDYPSFYAQSTFECWDVIHNGWVLLKNHFVTLPSSDDSWTATPAGGSINSASSATDGDFSTYAVWWGHTSVGWYNHLQNYHLLTPDNSKVQTAFIYDTSITWVHSNNIIQGGGSVSSTYRVNQSCAPNGTIYDYAIDLKNQTLFMILSNGHLQMDDIRTGVQKNLACDATTPWILNSTTIGFTNGVLLTDRHTFRVSYSGTIPILTPVMDTSADDPGNHMGRGQFLFLDDSHAYYMGTARIYSMNISPAGIVNLTGVRSDQTGAGQIGFAYSSNTIFYSGGSGAPGDYWIWSNSTTGSPDYIISAGNNAEGFVSQSYGDTASYYFMERAIFDNVTNYLFSITVNGTALFDYSTFSSPVMRGTCNINTGQHVSNLLYINTTVIYEYTDNKTGYPAIYACDFSNPTNPTFTSVGGVNGVASVRKINGTVFLGENDRYDYGSAGSYPRNIQQITTTAQVSGTLQGAGNACLDSTNLCTNPVGAYCNLDDITACPYGCSQTINNGVTYASCNLKTCIDTCANENAYTCADLNHQQLCLRNSDVNSSNFGCLSQVISQVCTSGYPCTGSFCGGNVTLPPGSNSDSGSGTTGTSGGISAGAGIAILVIVMLVTALIIFAVGIKAGVDGKILGIPYLIVSLLELFGGIYLGYVPAWIGGIIFILASAVVYLATKGLYSSSSSP